MAKPEAQLERSISAILTHNSTPVPEHELNCEPQYARVSPVGPHAVRTFPFLLLPFFPLLIDRGGAVAGAGLGGGCSRGAPVGTWLLSLAVCVVPACMMMRVEGFQDAHGDNSGF